MRYAALAVVVCLGGCSLASSGSECNVDSQCGDGDDVCARNGECLARSSVRGVTVNWTVSGVAAGASTCMAHPTLYLQFDSPDYGDSFRFAPVPCKVGRFFIDKLPRRYNQVEIGVEGGAGAGDLSFIDTATAQAQLDLFQ
jgi:hypothetical protein